ncbi:type II CAAX endopeptidase family protein [Streptosporangium sp. NPDC050280]|uniref:CPBP family intramembrane glutamic endopeptidase n=1 Tax=unclassified Streptosporangium TaxID=2632669 RepID=UPI0034355188
MHVPQDPGSEATPLQPSGPPPYRPGVPDPSGAYGPPPGAYGPPVDHYPPPPRHDPWMVPAPPGSRYDLLARTRLHAWWRPVLGTVAGLAGLMLAGLAVILGGATLSVIVGAEMGGSEEQIFTDPVLDLGINLLSIAVVLPIVYGVVAWIQRRPPGTLSSVTGRLRWRWMARCTAVAIGVVVLGQAAVAVTYVATGEDLGELFGWVGWERFLPVLVVTLLLVPFQAAAEEYVFRGWLIQAFGAFLANPWPGILLSTAAFTAVHAYVDWGIIDVFAFGALMGWLAVRTGGLEAAIALHVVNNVLAFGVSGADGSLPEALKQGSVPWQTLAGTVVQLGLYAIVVLAMAKRRRIETVSP